MITNKQLDEKVNSILGLKGPAKEEAVKELATALEDIELGTVDLILVDSFERLNLGLKESSLIIAAYYKSIICDVLKELKNV